MLNYSIEPELLRPLVPFGTELDSWNGKTFMSVVGFMFERTRVLGFPVPFHTTFEEVNLRFYVRRSDDTGWKRGVVFVKEIVPRRAIAVVARLLYNENYVALPMQHSIVPEERGSNVIDVEYRWRFKSRWNRLSVRTEGDAQPAEPGSEEEFITEHYWGYAAQRDGRSVEYQVEHPSWFVWQASAAKLDCDVRGLYGPEFEEALGSPCSSAFLALGSKIIVRRGVTISPTE